jgi:glycosyltransferase involved in cell wall biosynthesis
MMSRPLKSEPPQPVNPTEPMGPVEPMVSVEPRTVIVSWHWPPTNRASASVLGNLFSAAPMGRFRVVTRGFSERVTYDQRPTGGDLNARVPQTLVDWPLDDQQAPSLSQMPVTMRAIRRMIVETCRLSRTWGADAVMAVYPHRYSLLAGWRAARKLRLPLIVYMHDLLAEALTTTNRVKQTWWRRIDRACLNDASLVVVPTDEFAAHYRRRGVRNCFVLPHCLPDAGGFESNGDGHPMHLIYSGAIYEPHHDAAIAFINATKTIQNARITYLTRPDACNGRLRNLGARWVSHGELPDTLRTADVFVLFLGTNTSMQDEVHGCFPSKILDYIQHDRPILGVVPRGCFADRFIRETGCGITVHDNDERAIRNAIHRLRSVRVRERCAHGARAARLRLGNREWMGRLIDRIGVTTSFADETGRTETIDRREPRSIAEAAQAGGSVDCDQNTSTRTSGVFANRLLSAQRVGD